MRQGIESFPSPNQQRRPLPSLLSLSFFNDCKGVGASGGDVKEEGRGREGKGGGRQDVRGGGRARWGGGVEGGE